MKSKLKEYTESILLALLAAFLIRSFVIEPFKIPSGSMIPTLVIGDHIFVNKYIYGLRIPFTKKKVVGFKTPKRGEAVVFMYPIEEGKDFIKRVVGLPGDKIQLEGDTLLVNGTPVVRNEISSDSDAIPPFPGRDDFHFYIEELGENEHLMQLDDFEVPVEEEYIVPADHILVMGDNRDNSSDSRQWGFVPIENVKGRAMFIWLSIDYDKKRLRWERFGKWIE